MSYSAKGKHSSSRRQNREPEQWSEYVWSASHNRYYRYRKDASGEWEYDWGDEVTPPAIATTSSSQAYEKLDYSQPSFEEEHDTFLSSSEQPVSQGGTYSGEDSTYPDRFLSGGADTEAAYSGGADAEAIDSEAQPPWVAGPVPNNQTARPVDVSASGSSYPTGTFVPNTAASYTLSGIPENIVDDFNNLNFGSPNVAPQNEHQLDPRYKLADNPSRYFQIGRIFKTLWIEPASQTAKDTDARNLHPAGFGQLSYSKVRRFIVIRKRLHSCLCLPISTYSGRGAEKTDVRVDDHALVYLSGKPEPYREEGMTKSPFGIVIEEKGETLDSKSRIDFGKVYTVEHNVKVMNVGRIHTADKKRLNRYYNESMGLGALDDDDGDDDSQSQANEYGSSEKSKDRRRSGRGRDR